MTNLTFRMNVWRICIALLVCAVSCLPAVAQEYIFNHLTTQDELASNSIHCIWQDKNGYLWVGTEIGLQRGDGGSFIYPYFGSKHPVPELAVHQIVEDKTGRVWLRQGKNIGLFNPTTFEYKAVPVHFKKAVGDNYMHRLVKDAEGNVFLLVQGYNWFCFNPRTFAFEQDNTPFTIPDSLGVLTVFNDTAKQIFWAGGTKGLIAYDKRRKQMYTSAYNPLHLPLLNDKRFSSDVTSFFIDSRRRYWIVNWDMSPNHVSQNCYCYSERKHQYTKDTAGILNSVKGYYELNHFTEFGDSIVMVYGENCMLMNEDHMFEGFDVSNSLFNIQYNSVRDVFQDREKILWIATDNGLYNTLALANSSAHLVLDDEKTPASITCVMQYNDSNVWIGTWGRGVIPLGRTIYDNSTVQIYKHPLTDGDYTGVWDMVQHSKSHRVWVCCQAGKLTLYDPKKDQTSFLRPSVFANSTVRQVAEDKDGNLWFGCQNGTIVKWNNASSVSDSSFHKITSLHTFITDLYIDKRGLLWISNGGKGVVVIDTKNNEIVHHYLAGKGQGSLSDNNIRQTIQLNDSLYAFAGDVVNFLNIKTGEIYLATAYAGLPIGSVLTIQPDDQGYLWVSTPTGIYKYNNNKDSYVRYTQWDGLITVYNNSYTMICSSRLNDGQLVFGGNSNLVVFNPQLYSTNQPPTDVSITSILLFNQYLSVDSLLKLKEIELAHDQNSITIKFASLNFRQLNKLTYYYKLEGADKDWLIADQQPQATYNLLPPGYYTFLVRSQNENGIFSNQITRVRFYIRPSFWQSIWFYILLAMATAALLYYLHRLRVERLLQVEKVRTRLARDLHDDMGSTLSTINILSNMAMQKAGTDEKTTKEFISRISSNSSRMMEAMDDIVWSINPVNDSMRKITARMKEFAGNALEAQDIDYTFHIDEAVKDISFDMETRRSIFLIFKEAVNNILKYAEATEVVINMHIKKKDFILIIADNGKGFDPSKPVSTSRGNGVKNMQKRAETMKANIDITTEIGKGTSIQLCIPI